MKVYVATIWWADSDPLITIVTKSQNKTKKLALQYMKKESKDAYDNDDFDSLTDAQDSIRWGGVHAFDLKDLVKGREYTEAVADLKTGVAYLG